MATSTTIEPDAQIERTRCGSTLAAVDSAHTERAAPRRRRTITVTTLAMLGAAIALIGLAHVFPLLALVVAPIVIIVSVNWLLWRREIKEIRQHPEKIWMIFP